MLPEQRLHLRRDGLCTHDYQSEDARLVSDTVFWSDRSIHCVNNLALTKNRPGSFASEGALCCQSDKRPTSAGDTVVHTKTCHESTRSVLGDDVLPEQRLMPGETNRVNMAARAKMHLSRHLHISISSSEKTICTASSAKVISRELPRIQTSLAFEASLG